ncbi:MAG: SRPBCC domain-containing protein [Methanomassiliicoccus sp.]|nr:SRPBCC domain-containing protein [Methanomassiliicoccus sp.]
MKGIKGSIMIMAPAERVWAKMTDFSSYSKWNPWIKSMVGEFGVGNTYAVTTQPPGKGATDFKSKVVRIEEGKEVLLRGKVMGGLVKDDHLFSVEPIEPGKTIFFQSVVFSGPLVALAGSTIQASQKGLEEMNAALKKLCEES